MVEWKLLQSLIINIVLMFFHFYPFQVVGESGLFTPDDIAYVQEAGVKAVRSQILIVKHDS